MSDLHAAAMKGDLLSVQVLLDDKVDINTKHRSGETALHSASSEGHTDIIEELVDGGVDIDIQNWNGQTALHLSALKGHTQATRFLLCAGADCTKQTQYSGMTALHLATYNSHLEVVQILLKHQGDTIKDHVGMKAEFYSPTLEIRREFERGELQDGDGDVREESTLKGNYIEENDPRVREISSVRTSRQTIPSKTDGDIGEQINITNTINPSVSLSKSEASDDQASIHLLKPSLESINTYTAQSSTDKHTNNKTSTGNLIDRKYGNKDSKKISNIKHGVKTPPKNIYGKDDLPNPMLSKSYTPYKKLTNKKMERKSLSVLIDKKLDYSSKYKQ